jgi:hypothetical protein
MNLNPNVIFLLLGISPYIYSDVLEGRIGFTGSLTETTCAVTVGDVVKTSEGMAFPVTISFEMCPEKIIKTIRLSLIEVSSDIPSPDFMSQSHKQIVKGDTIEYSLSSRNPLSESNITLILTQPVSGASSRHSLVFKLSYD